MDEMHSLGDVRVILCLVRREAPVLMCTLQGAQRICSGSCCIDSYVHATRHLHFPPGFRASSFSSNRLIARPEAKGRLQ